MISSGIFSFGEGGTCCYLGTLYVFLTNDDNTFVFKQGAPPRLVSAPVSKWRAEH